MKGEVVAKGLEDQACLYCKGIQENLVPQVYYITDKNRIFNYEAQRAQCSYSLSLYSEQLRLSEILRGMWTFAF